MFNVEIEVFRTLACGEKTNSMPNRGVSWGITLPALKVNTTVAKLIFGDYCRSCGDTFGRFVIVSRDSI